MTRYAWRSVTADSIDGFSIRVLFRQKTGSLSRRSRCRRTRIDTDGRHASLQAVAADGSSRGRTGSCTPQRCMTADDQSAADRCRHGVFRARLRTGRLRWLLRLEGNARQLSDRRAEPKTSRDIGLQRDMATCTAMLARMASDPIVSSRAHNMFNDAAASARRSSRRRPA